MGIEALTHDKYGNLVIPKTDKDWREWVSATETRNYALNDPLLDWLALYGDAHGFQQDYDYPNYNERTDFSKFIFRKGLEFEAAIVKYLQTLVPVFEVISFPEQNRTLSAAQAVFNAMLRGEPVIYQAPVRDAETRTYGTPDLLVRSDQLSSLFPHAITEDEAAVPAPDLGDNPWHYRVVDIKYTTLPFRAGGELNEADRSKWAYAIQVYIYNRALGRLQGYTPPEAYLLGRGWQQTVNGQTQRGHNCLERLGPVPHSLISNTRGTLALAADSAQAWINRVRGDGHAWKLFPEPSVPELRPNMTSTSDQPWHHAKQQIGSRLEDLTLLWYVSVQKRDAANQAGFYRWTEQGYSAEDLGVNGKTTKPILQAVIDVNRSIDDLPFRPKHVTSAEEIWRNEPRLEFYVDFETVSDLDDNFSRIPDKNGQPLIFMIGCGHLEIEGWKWTCFTADALSEECESSIIDAWINHMDLVRQRIDRDGENPIVYHWSHAEQSTFETAFNSAKERHPENSLSFAKNYRPPIATNIGPPWAVKVKNF